MRARFALLMGLTGALALAGCAGDGSRYPSLGLRKAERRTFVVAQAPVPASNPAVQSTADLAQLDALRLAAESASAGFARKQPGAAALVARARGLGPESSAFAAAVMALSDLAAQRSATSVPLGELDRLAATEAAGEYPESAALTAAQTAVAALVAKQDAALDALWRDLGQ